MLWWLDRMVRTNQPLVERMALIWHDWFATADVDSQRLSIEQAQLFERRGHGLVPRSAARRHRRPGDADLALGGRQHERGAERELRPRDDGAVHARRLRRIRLSLLGRRRPRAGAGADRLDARVGRRRRLHGLPLRPRAATTRGPKTIFGQTGAFDWTDSCRLCVEPRGAQDLLRQQAVELLHPGAAVDARRARRSSGSTSSASYAIRPVVEAILMHPAFYRGPAMVKPPIVYIAGLLRARRQGVAQRLGVDRRHRRPAPLPPAERLRLERRPLARHLDLPRPLDRRQRDRRRTTRSTTRRSYDADESAEARGPAARSQFWGNPLISKRDPQGPRALRRRGRAPRRPRTGSRSTYRAAAPERAADAGRHLPRPADLLRSD